MYRHKLASKAVEMSEMLDKAHPNGTTLLGGLDQKSSEAAVEDLETVHEKMDAVAQGGTPTGNLDKVKKLQANLTT
jgi:hypothetical protein